MAAISTSAARMMARLRRRLRRRTDARLIAACDLFDREWYLAVNKDVSAAGIDPVVHYLEYGAAEGRNPSPQFDAAQYRELHPEARPANVNPLIHYLLRSRSAGVNRAEAAAGSMTARPRVLIVGALEIPQCFHYRVRQRQRQLNALGLECTFLDWRQAAAARAALAEHDIAIFFRVPAHAEQLGLIEAAQRRGMPTFWEVDDLIFDRDAYLANGNFHRLQPEVRATILTEIPKYLLALQACASGIASTPGLAEAMRQAGAPTVHVIENALDAGTIGIAQHVRADRAARPVRATVTIFYGSGSQAHDADFECAAAAIYDLMQTYPDVRLCIVGSLTLPQAFAALQDRIALLPACSFASYLGHLGGADINVVPLERSRFNEAKSTIKYIEASVLGLPSICSPRAPFKDIIAQGTDGFLAESPDEWRAALQSLVEDRQLRDRIGRAACDAVQRRYAPEAILRTQVVPFLQAAWPDYIAAYRAAVI